MIADPVVRNRGTIGGSLCQADAAEDLSAVCAAAKAKVVIRGAAASASWTWRTSTSGRSRPAVGEGELLTEVRLAIRPGAGSAHEKVERRAGDWAIAAASAALWMDGGTIADAGIALSAVGITTIHLTRAEELLRGQAPSEELFAQAGAIASEDCSPNADGRGPVDYKRHLAGVLTVRALRTAVLARTPPGGSYVNVSMTVNGEQVSHDVEPRQLLVHFIRETLDLTGTHWGCDTSNCGACVVLMDGKPVKSCTILAAMAAGHEIRTVESLEVDGELDPVQQGFYEKHALQCGFCTPGMLMTTRALLDENPNPSEHEIRTAISGAICRCTGYKNIVAAVQWAAEHRRREHGHDRGAPDRLRPAQAQGGPALHPRPGHLPGRHQAAGDGLRRGAAQPVRAREDRLDRHLRGARAPQRRGRHHRQGPGDARAWRGCRRSPTTRRRCWPATRCASRARRSRS